MQIGHYSNLSELGQPLFRIETVCSELDFKYFFELKGVFEIDIHNFYYFLRISLTTN